MMLQTEGGILAEADARVFHMLMSANRTTRRLMATDRTIAGAYARVATLRRVQQAQSAREHAKADRAVAKELGENRTAPGWGRTFTVKMSPAPTARRSGSMRSVVWASVPTRAIRAYKAPLIDKKGRVALYMNIKYVGFKSKGWRRGLSADHIEYILREIALELAETQLDKPLTNLGESVGEIMACWRALEAIEEGYRANAKVQHRIVWNLPHQLDADQRRELVEDFCERTFARLGLPYVAAIHTPDGKGDSRNFHAHICFSTRPCERTGDHEWAISEEKVNGLTDKAGLKLIRALGAAHMNGACRAAGVNTLFTHQTYAERGLDAERQAHIGPAAMAAHERGEPVAAIERNARIVQRNELAVERDAVARELVLFEKLVEMTKRSVDLSVARQRIARALSVGGRIADIGRSIAPNARRASPRDQHVAAERIAYRARAVGGMLAARVEKRIAVLRPHAIDILAQTARRLADHHGDRDRRRGAVEAAHRHVAQIEERMRQDRQAAAMTSVKQARALILNAQTPPYRVVDNRVLFELSAMTEHDRALVHDADRDAMVTALRERFHHDRELEKVEKRERGLAAERMRVAAEQRQAKAIQEVEAMRRSLADLQRAPTASDKVPANGAEDWDNFQRTTATIGDDTPRKKSDAIMPDRPDASLRKDASGTGEPNPSARQHTLVLAEACRASLMGGWNNARRFDGIIPAEQTRPDRSKAATTERPVRPWLGAIDPRDIGH